MSKIIESSRMEEYRNELTKKLEECIRNNRRDVLVDYSK